MPRTTVVATLLVAACATQQAPPSTCAAQAADLKAFLARVLDPAKPPLAPPWPTGDATRDQRIDELRARAREQLAPRDPTRKLTPLADGVQHGELEFVLAACPAARAQLLHFAEVEPAQEIPTFVGVADKIAGCGCVVDMPMVRALAYLGQRGPD